jgi:two-component system NtrC family sensor kinase
VPVLNKEGEVDFLVFSLIDVTEHKRAEEKLIESEKALQTAKRLSDIGGLAATVAHELRNPLGVIHAAAYNIKRKAKNPLIEGHLSNIEKKTREADQIINNLLFYARLRLPQFQPLNLYDTILECIETSRARFKGQRIIFKKNMRAVKKTLIEVDPVQIKEVFTNILNNAFEASLEQKGKIIVNASPDGPGNIRVSVRDSGPGIKEEYMERLFEPFFTTKTRGTGLGLAVCKQIVLLHSGKIDIESQEGKGTHVTVILPKTQTTSRIETDA